jgi:hypothetical protein
MAKSRAD